MPITLTPEDKAKLEDKQLANVLRALNAGKTLTRQQQAILDRASAPKVATQAVFFEPASVNQEGYAKTWDDLAAALRVEEKTLYLFRQKHAAEIHARKRQLTRADGRHVVAEWRKLADQVGELKGRGLNNPDCNAIDERQLRLRERLADVARAEHKLAEQTGEVLKLTEYQDALRVLVGAFDAALKQIPGRAAERIIELARQSMLTMLRAQLTPKQFEKLTPVLEKAPCDHAAILRVLEDEIEAPRRVLSGADFMEEEDPAPADTPAAV